MPAHEVGREALDIKLEIDARKWANERINVAGIVSERYQRRQHQPKHFYQLVSVRRRVAATASLHGNVSFADQDSVSFYVIFFFAVGGCIYLVMLCMWIMWMLCKPNVTYERRSYISRWTQIRTKCTCYEMYGRRNQNNERGKVCVLLNGL